MAKLHYEDEWLQVWAGDNRDALRQMPEKSVHAVITSPPYYGLRSYGTGLWDGGDPECDHERVASGRGTNIPQTKNPNVDYPIAPHRGGNPNECVRCGAIKIEPTIWGGDREHAHAWGESIVRKRSAGGERDYGSSDGAVGRGPAVALPSSNSCECGAWRGALGLEPTPELYIEHLVEVFREVWRVLRDDGVLWLNLGDSFAGGAGYQGNVKPKDLIGIPWMAAFALRADGWYLRGDVVWNKPNAMPESVEDRPARSHEFIFILTKEAHYFYDYLAVKEPASEATIKAVTARMKDPIEDREYQHDSETRMGKRSPNRVWSDPAAMERLLAGRNLRDVWTIPTVSYPGAHYATFPRKLVEPMVKASTSEQGVCAECGAPWERDVEVTAIPARGRNERPLLVPGQAAAQQSGYGWEPPVIEERGWNPSCVHEGKPVPATVLDPFGGSGTVGMVAQQLSRKAILIDLNAEYIEQQMTRNAQIGLGL